MVVVRGSKNPDYVIVHSKAETEDNQDKLTAILTYVNNVKQAGFSVQEEKGLVLGDLVCTKITASDGVLTSYANQHKVELTKDNPQYKYAQKIFFKCMRNVAASPKPEHPVVDRAPVLSGSKPTGFTMAERIMIASKILSEIKFGNEDGEIGFATMVSRKILLAAYPLHDSPYEWTESGPLSDRQLLARYWANIRCIYKEQPLTLIERYYGPEVGFYFAWMGCYTKMLAIPAVVGLVSFLIGLTFYQSEIPHIQNEICSSNDVVCPVCPTHDSCSFIPIKNSCMLMKLALVLENPMTIFYSILMSFWGVVFLVYWKRKQAMLRLRWNLHEASVDRSARPDFIKAATITRVSSLTGRPEYYLSAVQKASRLLISYTGVLLMFCVYILAIVLVMYYRLNVNYYGMTKASKGFQEVLIMFSTVTSSFLTFAIILILDIFKGKLCTLLNNWENPRTDDDYEKLYMVKLTIFSLSNTFFPMIYLAFVKGHFYTHPGDPTQWTLLGLFKSDVCPISGCLVDLSVQLATVMILKNGMRLFIDTMLPIVKKFIGKYRYWRGLANAEDPCYQWEEDFILPETSSNFLYNEYIQMVMQYGFMTFFVVSFPIAPLLAFVNNIFEIRFDALKILKHHRRIVPNRVRGIAVWSAIMQVITILGTISNPLLIAFSSNLIPKYIYVRKNNDSLAGFIDSTLSEFQVEDYAGRIKHNERDLHHFCLYPGMRNPPSSPDKYELTLEYWYQFSIKAVFFIILENVCLLLSLFLGYVIPEIPRKVQIKLESDQRTLQGLRLAN